MDTVPANPAVAAEILSLSDAAWATVSVNSRRSRNMRTIVALLIGALAAAQTPADVDRLEKALASHDTSQNRQAFQKALTTTDGVPLDQLLFARRALILWLIEHQPESKMFEEPFTLLWQHGRMGDPEGFEQAARLWEEQAARPGATAKTIADEALFFRETSPSQGLEILDRAAADHPGDPDLARARAILYVAQMAGVSGIGESNNRIRLVTNGTKRMLPSAARARAAIEASKDAYLLGAAGEFLTRTATLEIPGDATFGDDDAPALGERWLRRARELDPSDLEWNAPLGNAIRQRAQRTNDPTGKLRLFAEAYTLLPDNAKPGIRAEMAVAEFAAGDDASTERDARAMVDSPSSPFEYNLGQTLLGRVAVARGNVAEGNERLLASIKPPAKFKNPVFEPNMTLAQDVYDAGDHDAVVQFLEASSTVWKFDRGRIDRMISYVKKAPSVDLVQLSRQLPGNEMLRQPAPAFEATDRGGKTWTHEQLIGKVAVLEFGRAPLAEEVARGLGAILLQVRDDDTKRRFGVLTNPTVVVIDRQGNVTAYRSGAATQAEWRSEIESGLGRGSAPGILPAPKQADPMEGGHGKVSLAWEPIDGAESYVVEWDSRDEGGWIFDREHSVRVIPTRDASTVLEVAGFMRVRWRVYAVPKTGPSGAVSPWREVDGAPVTKIYK